MLVLSRHRNEKVDINGGFKKGDKTHVNGCTITIVDIRGDKVRLGFEADPSTIIHRSEVQDKINDIGSSTN